MISKKLLYPILGIWIALIPFSGFPGSWKTFLIVISGFAIAFLSSREMIRSRFEKVLRKDSTLSSNRFPQGVAPSNDINV